MISTFYLELPKNQPSNYRVNSTASVVTSLGAPTSELPPFLYPIIQIIRLLPLGSKHGYVDERVQ